MKRTVWTLSLCLLTACTSPEFLQLRADYFATQETKKMLYIPDSHESIETKIDSAILSTHNDPIILNAAASIKELQDMNFFRSRSTNEKIQRLAEQIKERASTINCGEFFGWEIRHRCRVKDNNGKVNILDLLYITDTDFSDSYFAASLNKRDNDCYTELVDLIDAIVAENVPATTFIEEIEESISDFIESLDTPDIVNDIEQSSKGIVKDIRDKSTNITKYVDRIAKDKQSQIEAISEEIYQEVEQAMEQIVEQVNDLCTELEDIDTTPHTTSTQHDDGWDNDNSVDNTYIDSRPNNNTISSNTLIELNNL